MAVLEDKMIVKTKTINATTEAVWKRWTTRDGLQTFFGADNQLELKIGGAFEIYFLMDNPYGTRGSEGCQVLSFLPQRMLSFSWNAPPQFEAIRNGNHKTWVVLELEEQGASTKITLSHLGWLAGSDWDAVYAYFEKAWDMVLNRLEANF